MIYSTTIKTDNSQSVVTSDSLIPPIVFNFELGTGNEGMKTVVEPMLRTRVVAEQRARREFLDNGYPKRYTDIDTWRTDLELNDIILVAGVKYKVELYDILTSGVKTVTNLKGVHYG